MRLSRPWIGFLALAVCGSSACGRLKSPPVPASPTLDSLVLDRGACYGTCETYQFVLRQTGSTVVKKSVESRAKLTPDESQRLLISASDAGVLTLPSLILSDITLCPLEASDHSTITLTAYAGARVRRVEHYTGCYIDHELRVAPRLERLVILERRIDALVRM
jgi:hypothetical protein